MLKGVQNVTFIPAQARSEQSCLCPGRAQSKPYLALNPGESARPSPASFRGRFFAWSNSAACSWLHACKINSNSLCVCFAAFVEFKTWNSAVTGVLVFFANNITEQNYVNSHCVNSWLEVISLQVEECLLADHLHANTWQCSERGCGVAPCKQDPCTQQQVEERLLVDPILVDPVAVVVYRALGNDFNHSSLTLDGDLTAGIALRAHLEQLPKLDLCYQEHPIVIGSSVWLCKAASRRNESIWTKGPQTHLRKWAQTES